MSRIVLYFALAATTLFAFEASARKPKSLAQQFFFKPDIEAARISPGNRYLSYIGYNGKRSLFTYEFDTGRRRSVSAESGHSVYDHYWVSQDEVLIFAQRLGIPSQVFSTNRRLSLSKANDYVEVYDLIPDRENKLLIKDTGRSEKFFDLELYDIESLGRKTLIRNPGHIISWFTDKDGIVRIRQWVDENEDDRFEYRAHPDAPWKKINPGTDSYGILFLNEPEKTLAFYRPDGGDRVIARAFDCAKNAFYGPIIEDPNYDLIPEEYIMDPETEEVFGFRYQSDRRRTIWFQESHHRLQEQINQAFPQTLNDIHGFASNGLTVVRRHSDRHPGEWLLFDRESGDTSVIGSERPWIDPNKMSPVNPITYPGSEGKEIHALLTSPRGGSPGKGLVVMIHGGPRARDYWGWDSEAQYFAALGYTVMKINYRGSSDYGLQYSPYSHLESIRASIVDTADGVKWAIKQGYATPGQIAIYGSSFGGHVALRTAAEHPSLFACVIGYAGVYDWVKEMDREFAKEPVYWKLKLHTYYGDYDNEKDRWQAASAITVADQIAAPVYLLHGGSDEIVASRQSRQMHKALTKAGKDSSLKILGFNSHGMVQEKPTIRFYENLAKFIEDSF